MQSSAAESFGSTVSRLEVRVEMLEQRRAEDADRANRLEAGIQELRGLAIKILASSLGSVLLLLIGLFLSHLAEKK